MGESILRELSILRSGSPIDCDVLLSYPLYPSPSLDAPKKEPLKAFIDREAGGRGFREYESKAMSTFHGYAPS
jgi:hypothetical protein